jgi:YesN/AraC family two-component response regulator
MPIHGPIATSQAKALLAPDGSKAKPRLLLVDDTEIIRTALDAILGFHGFEVVTATNVNEALKLIGEQKFDVLLSDLHMPQPGDGLTVVSAMRHSNPQAVTLIFSAYPEMKSATAAILLQADDILVKPMAADLLVKTIWERLDKGPSPERAAVEDVGTILEQETQSTIDDWLKHVNAEPEVITVVMDAKKRCAHLPRLFADLVARLRNPLPLGTRALVSPAAAQHGLLRREQGYTAAMMVEESRMLQVSIFQALDANLYRIDFSLLLTSVMAIADEVDSQLAQQMTCYIAESKIDGLPQVA